MLRRVMSSIELPEWRIWDHSQHCQLYNSVLVTHWGAWLVWMTHLCDHHRFVLGYNMPLLSCTMNCAIGAEFVIVLQFSESMCDTVITCWKMQWFRYFLAANILIYSGIGSAASKNRQYQMDFAGIEAPRYRSSTVSKLHGIEAPRYRSSTVSASSIESIKFLRFGIDMFSGRSVGQALIRP